MTIRMYCDACDTEIDNYTIRPRIEVTIYSPQDGSLASDEGPMFLADDQHQASLLSEFAGRACYESFDQRGELLRSVVEYMDAPSGTVSVPAPEQSDTWRPAKPGDTPGELVPGECDVPLPLDLVRSTQPEDADRRMNSWTFCDPCLMAMRNWLRGFVKVRGHLQEPKV